MTKNKWLSIGIIAVCVALLVLFIVPSQAPETDFPPHWSRLSLFFRIFGGSWGSFVVVMYGLVALGVMSLIVAVVVFNVLGLVKKHKTKQTFILSCVLFGLVVLHTILYVLVAVVYANRFAISRLGSVQPLTFVWVVAVVMLGLAIWQFILMRKQSQKS